MRNLQDAKLTVTRALTAADGSVTSPDIDLGANNEFFPEEHEFVVKIPELSATELANADTLKMVIQHGDSATPTTALGIENTVTGDGSTVPETEHRFRLPSDVKRYVNVKFTTAGTTGDMSDKTAEISLRN